ncbi:MAG: hypothetical protein R8M37_03700 [Alphaproteobacteria bacterium]|nr:hypothetical protein [Alphaproteobacteria bacterium]
MKEFLFPESKKFPSDGDTTLRCHCEPSDRAGVAIQSDVFLFDSIYWIATVVTLPRNDKVSNFPET